MELIQALMARRRIFLGAWALFLLVVIQLRLVTQSFEGPIADIRVDPNIITGSAILLIAWSFFAAIIILRPKTLDKILIRKRFEPERGERTISLKSLAQLLSFIGATMATTAILYGFLVVTFTGEFWRVFIFVALGLPLSALCWKRVGQLIEAAVQKGLT